jgi:magnesium-transporting ATPase (P-type)
MQVVGPVVIAKQAIVNGAGGPDDAGPTRPNWWPGGSKLVRWAAVEAVQRIAAQTSLGQLREQVGNRRRANIGKVAAARELTKLVFYGLRDGHIRRLLPPPRTPAA